MNPPTGVLFGAMATSPGMWVAVLVGVPVLLALELSVLPRGEPIPVRVAARYSLLWFALGAAFAIPVGLEAGQVYSIKYLSGFFVEKGLDVDQVLMFAVILEQFRTPREVGRRVIYIALVAGLVLRVPFIAIGVTLGESDRPLEVLAIAAVFVLVAAVLVTRRNEEPDPRSNRYLVRLEQAGRVLPAYEGNRLTVRHDHRRELTLAGVVLVVMLTADLFFAATVPLAFAYSKPGFLVLASSAFAVLGFRSLYYLVIGLRLDVPRLKVSLAVVFCVVGAQLVWHEINEGREPGWFIPVLGFLAIAVPVVAAIRGIEEELEEADEP